MEKKVGEQFLFDFYGELLTEKQKQILDYYYNEDYSLAEIASVMSVTRQGIFDVIKRSKAMMEVYEEKLGLVEKFLRAQMLLEDIQKDLAELTKGIKDLKLKSQLNSVIEKLKKVSDEN